MKSIITLAALVIGCIASRAQAELPKAELDEVVKLIKDIMPPHVLNQSRYAVSHPEIAGADEAERAGERIARTKAAIPKLRKLIKLKTNIFDYPGLLSRGFLTSHDDFSKEGYHVKYHLLIAGSGNEAHDASAPSPADFGLYFDDRGVIESISDVPVAK